MSINMDEIEKQDTVATEAVEWFLRIEREEPALDILAEWQRWLDLSPAHRAAYESIQRTWTVLDNVSAWRWTPRVANFERFRPRLRRIVWSAAASLGVAAASAFITVQVMRADVYRTKIETSIGEHRELVLPDGSRVQVGARSLVKVRLTPQLREVRLVAGEAFFSVAQDVARPFIVDAGISRVTAIGTAFNVRRYGNAIAVQVAEGRVRMESGLKAGPTALLNTGEETMIEQTGAVQTVRALPTENVAAWRHGRHSYIDEPLSLVIADLNRYSTRPVSVDDTVLAELRITTTFFSSDWQAWLHTLESAVPALEVKEERRAVRIVSRSTQ